MRRESNNVKNLSNSDNVPDIVFREIDHFSVIEDIKNNNYPQYYKTDYVFHLFLTEGHGEISIDDIYYKLDSNEGCLLSIIPQNIIGTTNLSKDSKGYLLGIHKRAIEESIYHIKQKIVFPLDKMLHHATEKYHVLKFSGEEKETVNNSLLRIKKAYDRKDFKFHEVLIKLTVVEYLLEVLNIMLPKFLMEDKTRKVGYKESICNDFILMAMDNHRQHHTLDYYADRLHISTQYLTHLVRTTHGMTANKVINDMILLDAKAMLKLPTKSVKEIAFELNFADQSSFGKFFKKHTGISASKYRKTK